MTFISTIVTKQGMILAADSKELLNGSYITWNDFDSLLNKKSLSNNDENLLLSPSEISQLFHSAIHNVDGRIRSVDGAIKIFKITTHTGLLISGIANPGGVNFPQIVNSIKTKITNESYENVLDVVFAEVQPLMDSMAVKDEEKSTLIFCGFDKVLEKFRTHILFFAKKYDLDDNGNILKDSLVTYFFKKREVNQRINIGGSVSNAEVMVSNLNHLDIDFDIIQGFEFSKGMMDLIVNIESMTNPVPGIGGRIFFAAITKNGFYWINSISDLQNLIE